MKLSYTTTGFGIMAVAGLMLCTAAIADTMGGKPGDMGHMRPMPTLEAMDANKDGKVSKDEVTAFRAAQTAAIDTNADGKLSVDELSAMHLKRMTEAAKTMAQKMVDRMDTDGDGMLSASELVAPPMPVDLFDRVDFFIAQDSQLDHQTALVSMFEILEVTSRGDLKSDLLQELDRQRLFLEALRNNPAISEQKLNENLSQALFYM